MPHAEESLCFVTQKTCEKPAARLETPNKQSSGCRAKADGEVFLSFKELAKA